MSFSDALSRISQIQQQITALTDGATPTPSTAATAATAGAATAGAATGTDNAATAAQFAQALAQAQQTGTSALPASATAALVAAPGALASGAPVSGGAPLTGPASTAALPAAASSMLTSGQQQFASTLVAETGLNPGVVSAWLLAEENGGAAQSRQSNNNNDWLNIGYTDSGTVGAADAIWSDPVSAANATAGWLKGQDTIPGYGTASSGIQSILSSVGQTPAAQISALQNSGWASSGYPDLASLYNQVNA